MAKPFFDSDFQVFWELGVVTILTLIRKSGFNHWIPLKNSP